MRSMLWLRRARGGAGIKAFGGASGPHIIASCMGKDCDILLVYETNGFIAALVHIKIL